MENEEYEEELSGISVPRITEVQTGGGIENLPASLEQEASGRSVSLEQEGPELPMSLGREVLELPSHLNVEYQDGLRARNASAARTSVGDLAGRLLEYAGDTWMRESGESTDLKRRWNVEWSVPDKKTQQETAAERLYGRVSTVWLRQAGGEQRNVVVTTQENAPSPALNVRDVDRAFQRDARRYDGGLHLL